MQLNRCRYFRGFFTGIEVNGKLKWLSRKPAIIDQETEPLILAESKPLAARLRHRVNLTLRKSGADPDRSPKWPADLERFKLAAHGFCVFAAEQEELTHLEQQAVAPDQRKELKLQMARLERAMQRAVEELAQLLR